METHVDSRPVSGPDTPDGPEGPTDRNRGYTDLAGHHDADISQGRDIYLGTTASGKQFAKAMNAAGDSQRQAALHPQKGRK